MTKPSPAEYITATGPAVATLGNTPWAVAMAGTIRALVERQAAGSARNVQVHLGPSELGVDCDRLIVGKLLGHPEVASMDPWPSIVGTALHSWLESAFRTDDPTRWLAERRVTPHRDHAGTMDLFDTESSAVIDHKCLGEYSMTKIRTRGPSRQYQAQLALYALGAMRAGLQVDRVAIAAYPRQGPSLSGLYVWEHAMDAEMKRLLEQVFADTQRRKDQAAAVQGGVLAFESVPVSPGEDCTFCPFSTQCPYFRR